jgi:hypothetical protein
VLPQTTQTLASLGVPDTTISLYSEDQWQHFLAELDRFYAWGYGGQTQQTWLRSRNPDLNYDTPLEALKESSGITRVEEALLKTLKRLC